MNRAGMSAESENIEGLAGGGRMDGHCVRLHRKLQEIGELELASRNV